MHISCIRGRTKLVGKGIYRQVFKVKNFLLKIEKGRDKGIVQSAFRIFVIKKK